MAATRRAAGDAAGDSSVQDGLGVGPAPAGATHPTAARTTRAPTTATDRRRDRSMGLPPSLGRARTLPGLQRGTGARSWRLWEDARDHRSTSNGGNAVA